MKTVRMASRSAILILAIGLPTLPARAERMPATSAASAPMIPAVSVTESRWREIVETIVVTGTLMPRDEILLTPEIEGYRVTEVLVEEGARVQQGQVLARLSHELIDRQLAQQTALVDKAAAAVPQAESGIAQAEAAETEARLAFDRARQLMQTGNSTAAILEGRTSVLRQAEGKLAFARNGLVIAKAELAQAKAVRDELDLRLARTEIRAPEAGIVSRRTARVGLAASSSAEPLFRLIARGEIELEGEVIETRLPQLVEGAPASIELGDGTRVRGQVRTVYPEVDKATRLGKVRVSLAPDPRLRIGTFVRGGIELARSQGVTVPQAAIAYKDGERTVLVVRDGHVRVRAVRTGLSDDESIEIRSGLEPGDRVVARAGSFLRDGDLIRTVLRDEPDLAAVAARPAHRDTAEAGNVP